MFEVHISSLSLFPRNPLLFIMPSDDRPLILGLSIAFPIIAITAVILRFEARRINRLKLGADDWTILAALVKSPFALNYVFRIC